MHPILQAVYHVRAEARSVAERANAIAIEQSVEMPVAAIDDATVRDEIVGRVTRIEEMAAGLFAVHIGLAGETVGRDPGQLINMLFGNTSLHDDVRLHDVELPAALVEPFGGPHHGLAGLRKRVGAPGRALTCSALKPQGLPPAGLADLAHRFAAGGIDYVKDDHGLADQTYSPFAARVEAVAAAVRRAGGRDSLRAEPVRRPRHHPGADRGRPRQRHRHRHGRADDHGPRQFPPAHAGER